MVVELCVSDYFSLFPSRRQIQIGSGTEAGGGEDRTEESSRRKGEKEKVALIEIQSRFGIGKTVVT